MAWVTAETALGALILILPGFVFVATQERLVPSARRDFSKSAIEFFGYGGINFVLFSWALVPRIKDWSAMTFTAGDYVLAPLVSVVAPFLAAVAWVRLSHSNALEKIAGMGASRRTPEPAAWDFFFGRRDEPCWVLVRLRDGGNVAGIYEPGCYASRYPEAKSLYLKRIYRTDADGAIVEPVDGSAGALIDGTDIHLVEFWNIEETKETET